MIKNKNEFGGSLLQGKRRERRPLDSKRPTHLILKATDAFKLLQNTELVESTLKKYGNKLGVKVFEFGVNADHVHIAIQAINKTAYVRWIRAVTSVLVQKIAGLKWKFRPFTRVATWGRDFARLRSYIHKNATEGRFIVAAEARLTDFKARLEKFFETHIGPFFTP